MMGKLDNMKLEKGMLITLTDEKEYIVISIALLDNVKYVYLAENNKMENMKFCIEEIEKDKIKLTEVEDLVLRQKLLKEFVNDFKQELS